MLVRELPDHGLNFFPQSVTLCKRFRCQRAFPPSLATSMALVVVTGFVVVVIA